MNVVPAEPPRSAIGRSAPWAVVRNADTSPASSDSQRYVAHDVMLVWPNKIVPFQEFEAIDAHTLVVLSLRRLHKSLDNQVMCVAFSILRKRVKDLVIKVKAALMSGACRSGMAIRRSNSIYETYRSCCFFMIYG